MIKSKLEFKVDEEISLYEFLRKNISNKSKNNIKSMLTNKCVTVDNKIKTKHDYKLKLGNIVKVTERQIKNKFKEEIDVIYEDKNIIVINKPHGLLSISTTKEKEKTAYMLVIFVGFVIYYGFAMINSPFLKEYSEASVCYEYYERELTNYSLTRYHKDSYNIEYELWEDVLDEESGEIESEWIEDYWFTVSLEDDKVTITNEMIEESIKLDYIVEDYLVIKSDDTFLIGILVQEKEGSVLYYSNYITEENISNDKEFLNKIKSSFMRFVLPDSTSIVALHENDSDEPLIAVQNKFGFTYIDDEDVYIVYI